MYYNIIPEGNIPNVFINTKLKEFDNNIKALENWLNKKLDDENNSESSIKL